MRKTLITLAMLGVAATAAPASAQYYGGGYGVRGEIHQLENRVRQARANRAISRVEARRRFNDLAQLRNLARQYSYGGLTRRENRDLRYRLSTVERSFRYDLRSRDGRGYGRDGYDRGGYGYDRDGYRGDRRWDRDDD